MSAICLLCSKPLKHQLTWNRFIFNEQQPVICPTCHSKFECVKPEQQKSPHVHALFHYNEAMKDFLHQYKFLKDIVLKDVFRQEIANALKNVDAIIVPIPMHPDKMKTRTFAHIDELLKAAGIPYTHLLEKISSESQSSKSKSGREQSAQLFRLKLDANIENRSYILIDDIVTTGTTLEQAKAILIEAGAPSVKALTLIQG
ncbi:ComF family protein [Viridibacillus sp. YIM B01967]|uniref:ComF family protein n=1 Tax=Viridibacillus soli TaxID=2798301 RepID=A0ABS1H5Z9_9BACL|nr:phosphoribosyltransferase family protein [Viridibacillus soli]MBK3494821.1 ComF family protein [Viridibacillus soli]